MRHTRTTRVMIGAIVLQALWIAAGCCSIEYTTEVEMLGIETIPVDNSGPSPVPTTADNIPAKAFGFILAPLDTHRTTFSALPALGAGQTALAFSTCPESYTWIVLDTMRSVRIFRIDSLNGRIDDVSASFVAIPSSQVTAAAWVFDSFVSLERLPAALNTDRDIGNATLILRHDIERIKGTGLRFLTRIELTDDAILTDTIGPITLY